jgi:hypothetical protein
MWRRDEVLMPSKSACPGALQADHRGKGRQMRGLQPHQVMVHLRRCGVVVHLVTRMPSPSEGDRTLVVFLEGNLGQSELARASLRHLPGVAGVTFSGLVPSIMYVTSK